MNTRREVLRTAAMLLAASPLSFATAQNADYPSRPVTIIVPFAPGQSADILARVLGEYLGRRWGKPVLVKNIGGAGGSVGSLAAVRSAADGYTLLMGSTGPTAIAPQLSRTAGYDSRTDLTTIVAVAGVPQMLLVAADSPYRTMKDLIDDARRNPDKLSYGTGGSGSLAHLTMEMFKRQAGIDIRHVPYKGAGQAYPDLIAGRLQVMFDTTPAAISFVKSGQLRFLAASTATRTAAAPDVPTVAEAGLKGFEVLGWLGVLAPAKLDPALRGRLNQDFLQVMGEPAVRERLEALGLTPIGGSAEDFEKYLAGEYEKFGNAIKAANVTVE